MTRFLKHREVDCPACKEMERLGTLIYDAVMASTLTPADDLRMICSVVSNLIGNVDSESRDKVVEMVQGLIAEHSAAAGSIRDAEEESENAVKH